MNCFYGKKCLYCRRVSKKKATQNKIEEEAKLLELQNMKNYLRHKEHKKELKEQEKKEKEQDKKFFELHSRFPVCPKSSQSVRNYNNSSVPLLKLPDF